VWWFILIALTLPVFGWLFFDIIGNLTILGRVLSLFGRPGLQNVMGAIIVVLYLPPLFLVIALCTDVWWSCKCWTGTQDACTYNTVFLPELHPDTPDLWKPNPPSANQPKAS
jgi:hypothetical protein